MIQFQYKKEIDVTLVQFLGGDYCVAAAAKVSTCGEDALQYMLTMQDFNDNPLSGYQKKKDEQYGLINYLMKHRHGTPFEHSCLTFYVHAPIFVWREWHRHRIGFSYNEESGRYKTLEPTFYLPPRDRPMMKVEDWKPGRPKFLPCDDYSKYDTLCSNLVESYKQAYLYYINNLEMGFDPGLARDCLPVGIYSGCWVTCNPRSMMAFLSLRTHEPDSTFVSYPLWEIDQAARKCEELFAKHFPLIHKAFNANGRVAP